MITDNNRNKICNQLVYLIEEVEAFRKQLEIIPEDLLCAKPLGKWSIKEIYGHLVNCDCDIYLPRLRQMVAEDRPAFKNIDPDQLVIEHTWNEHPIDDILNRLILGRRALHTFLKGLPNAAWTRKGLFPDGTQPSVADLALHIGRHDVHHLRALTYRLHESHLGNHSR